MIPSCNSSPISLNNEYIQKILDSSNGESINYDISSIKNVTEVFGKTYDIDRMSTTCSTSSNIYTIALSNYESYKSNEYIAITVNTTNIANMKMRINSLEIIPIYLEDSTTYVGSGIMLSNEVYVVKIKKVNGNHVAYYLGQYQPHALCVLTNNENDTKFTKQYFSEKYNCNINNIVFRVEDSPFTIQKIGEILDYKSGNDFDNIESDSVAQENALYQNKKSTTFNDTVTITTKLIPWLDVFTKVTYKRKQESEEQTYIIKTINHDLDGMKTTITMYRFYPLY